MRVVFLKYREIRSAVGMQNRFRVTLAAVLISVMNTSLWWCVGAAQYRLQRHKERRQR